MELMYMEYNSKGMHGQNTHKAILLIIKAMINSFRFHAVCKNGLNIPKK